MTFARDLANFADVSANNLTLRNPIINSDMSIWQRGTSFTANNSYTADRWYTATTTTNFTISRQTTSDTTNLPNIQYAIRLQRNSGQTGTGDQTLTQSIETVNSIPFAGRKVVFSFYLRVGANFSGANFLSQVRSGTGTDQNMASGFTGSSSFINNTVVPTTTWTRYTYSGTVATNATQLGIYFGYTPVGTAGTNDWFEVTGVKLEIGNAASSFVPAGGGSQQAELALCQRYYEKSYNLGTNPGTITDVGAYIWVSNANTATIASFPVSFKVSKRGTPVITVYSNVTGTSGQLRNVDGAADAAGSAYQEGENNFSFRTSAASAASVRYAAHFVAVAEL